MFDLPTREPCDLCLVLRDERWRIIEEHAHVVTVFYPSQFEVGQPLRSSATEAPPGETVAAREFASRRGAGDEEPFMAVKPAASHPNAEAFPARLSGPALRALGNAGIRSIAQLAEHSEASVAALHGMGPKGVRLLKDALTTQGLWFRER